jgi:hypothetical protein
MEVARSPTASLIMGPEQGERDDGETAAPVEGLIDVQVYTSSLTDEQILGLATESKALASGLTLPFTPWQVRDFWDLQVAGKVADKDSGTGGDPAAARELASKCLELGQDPCRGFQDEVICDFFVSLLEYAQTICLTPRKTAVFVAIMQWIFTSMFRRSQTSACVGEPFSSSECFLEYKRLLLEHAATAAGALSAVPPRRLQIFSTSEVKRLTEFVSGTLFQHFFLYQCVLVNPQDAAVRYTSLTLEGPRRIPSLEKAKLLPPKKEPSLVAALDKTGSGELDRQASTVDDTACVGSDGGGIAGPGTTEFAEDGEDDKADVTQVLSKARGPSATSGALPEDEHLDFLVSEASKALEQHIEAKIQERDKAFQN